ncbi:MAG: hypothetical protein VKS61_15665 [Candidatus Sericytochromatia bacterium]|nr:hypothetical protein [Candidatus Sericytochromatia bacterium]
MSEVLGTPEFINLYQCFPYCGGAGPTPPPSNPISFTIRVVESSSPALGSGTNGGVPSASVVMTGDRDNYRTFTTDSGGYVSNTYRPEATPTFTGSRWGISSTGGPGATITLYTDSTMKLGLAPGSAPDAEGATFNVTAAANGGGSGTLSRALRSAPSVPALIKVPRNGEAGGSIRVTAADHPRFTWNSESPLALTSSANVGKPSNDTMRFQAIHKWVRVAVDFRKPAINEDLAPIKLTAYAYAVDGAGKPVYGTPLGVPTYVGATGSTTPQSNPSAEGQTSMWFWSLRRLEQAGAPYVDRFFIHAEGGFWISKPDAANELVVINDAARVSGVITKTIELLQSGGGK